MKRREFFQKSILICSIIGINPIKLFSSIDLDIGDFEKCWSNYIESPNDKTARKLYTVIPLYDSYDKSKKDRIFNQIDLDIELLETQINKGHKSSLDLAFKLYSITDGALASIMNMIIGPYMHIDPEYFLLSLNKHIHLVSLGGVLRNYGLDYVDEFEMQNQETTKRIQALRKVQNPELYKVKIKCLSILENSYISQEVINQVKNLEQDNQSRIA